MLNRFNNYLIGQGIQTNIHNYPYSGLQPLKLNLTNINVSFIQSRDVLDNNGVKFAEKVTFNNGGNNFVVAIGYNPALNVGNAIDKTNYMVANHFNNLGYDGYYLFNMFADVSVNKTVKQTSTNPNYIDIVLNFLINDSQNSKCDIFIFWGSSVYLSYSVIGKLNNLQNNYQRNLNTIGTVLTQHKHPGRGVKLSTIASFSANLNQLVNGNHYLK